MTSHGSAEKLLLRSEALNCRRRLPLAGRQITTVRLAVRQACIYEGCLQGLTTMRHSLKFEGES